MNIEVGLISKIENKENYLHVLNERIKKDFFEEHDEVFEAISSHYSKYGAVPERETLQKAFPNFQFYEGEEPLQFFIDKIKEQYKKKLFNTTLPKVAELLPTDINEAEKLLQNLLSTSKGAIRTGTTIDSRASTDTRIALYENREANLGIDGYSTSWDYLDNLTCGYHPGELIVWMGRAKMCKTWLLTWQFHHIWKEHNAPSLLVTKEISPDAIQWRFDAIECRLPYEALRHGELSPAQKDAWTNRIKDIEKRTVLGELNPYAIKGFDLTDGSSGVSSIIPYVEQYLGDGGVLFVDGLYLIPDDRGESEWRGIVNVATDLKILAQTYNIPVIATTQQSMEDKSDVPRLENAAYGKYIVQYADAIIGIGRSDIDRKANRGIIYILGQREGDIGSFPINMRFDPIDFSQAQDKSVDDKDYNEDDEVINV